MGGFSGNDSGYGSGDAKTDLGGMRGSDGTNNDYGDRNGGFSQDGKSSASVSVSDLSTSWDGKINDIGSTEKDLAQSRADLAAAGISRDQNSNLGSSVDAHDEFSLARAATSKKAAEAYAADGLEGIPDQVRDTMVGDLGLTDDLRSVISSRDRADLSRDLASRTSNGTLGKIAGLAGLAGSVVNAGIDARQANSISNRAFGVDPGFSETLGTFARSGIKNAAGSLVGGQISQTVGGALSGTLGPSAAGLLGMAVGKKANDFINNPDTYSEEESPDRQSISEVARNGDGLGLAVNPAESNTSADATKTGTGYGSSFGNYDSHLTGFDYANLALKSWS
jgi:hypothetical protein